MTENLTFILLIVSFITLSCILFLLRRYKKDNQIKNTFKIIIGLALWWVLLELLQIILHQHIDALDKYDIYFESLASIGKCFMPVFIFLLGLAFARTKIEYNKKYLLLFIIPTLTIILMLTNEYHHLVYEKYSIYTYEAILGPYAVIHQIYSYGMLMIGMISLLYYSIKNSGFFSKQSILLVIGTIIPLIINVLETFKIVKLSVYSTPISFAFAVAIYALAIFKFKFLSVTPIALQRIVDRISDSYVVLSEDGNITDYNKTFLTTFKIKEDNLRGKELISFLKSEKFSINEKRLKDSIKKATTTQKVISYEEDIENINKSFMIEISSISSKETFLGIVILLKDITQHKQDIQIIKENQEQLMEKERLSSLGQLVGGIAHNLKTPIMSISGAAEGISDLIKEYESSIGDPEVTVEDHHEIASDMMEWISKIKTHTEYMSDIITAVKGQAVALSEDTNMTFTIDELIKRVNILMKHELKNAIIYLNTNIETDKNLELKGDVNSLVQVINNMISNSIQAYAGKPEQTIDMIVSKQDNNIIISIKDYANGLPKAVKDKLFKEMVTTKGKNGTGLGLYMSYSNIRAHFGGNITVESEEGKGTTFNIILPI